MRPGGGRRNDGGPQLPPTTVVLVGPPGSGKSTLGNLLVLGNLPARSHLAGPPSSMPFEVSEAFENNTAEVTHADFTFQGKPHRAIDTTGLFDGAPNMAGRLANCARLAPGGIDAWVMVMRKGRFTDELYNHLVAFQDAAGKGALARTVVVFTHCGRETTEQLVARCKSSGNARLQDIMAKIPAILAVESLLPARMGEDRGAVLDAVAGVCRANGCAPKSIPVDPSAMRLTLQEIDKAASHLSEERQDAIREKLRGVEAGCASLDALRSALSEAKAQQTLEERRREEQKALDGEFASVRQQADMYRGAAASVQQRASRGAGRGPPGAFGACCTPTCHESCDPCKDGATELLHEWRRERESEIERKFAEADAYAAAAESQRGQQTADVQRQPLQPWLRAGARAAA